MYDEINTKIQELKAGVDRSIKLERILISLKRDKDNIQQKLVSLKDQLDKENRDIEKFEGLSLTGMFHKLFGNYDVKLDKEKQEAFAAQIKYNHAYNELQDIEYEIKKRAQEKLKYADCNKELELIYNQKIEMVKSSTSKYSGEAAELSAKIDTAKLKKKEIDEAFAAGELLVSELQEIDDSLKSAQGWGVWDMIGGGVIASAVKHSHINDAKNKSRNVQNLLRRFKNELLDIEVTDSISINIAGFDTFIDFFADGLIADYFIQTKINSAKKSVENMQEQINRIMSNLSYMKNENDNIINSNNQRLTKILNNI